MEREEGAREALFAGGGGGDFALGLCAHLAPITIIITGTTAAAPRCTTLQRDISFCDVRDLKRIPQLRDEILYTTRKARGSFGGGG